METRVVRLSTQMPANQLQHGFEGVFFILAANMQWWCRPWKSEFVPGWDKKVLNYYHPLGQGPLPLLWFFKNNWSVVQSTGPGLHVLNPSMCSAWALCAMCKWDVMTDGDRSSSIMTETLVRENWRCLMDALCLGTALTNCYETKTPSWFCNAPSVKLKAKEAMNSWARQQGGS